MRFSLFVIVTLYAWGAIIALEWLRARSVGAVPETTIALEYRY